jgi:hypothetical protein
MIIQSKTKHILWEIMKITNLASDTYHLPSHIEFSFITDIFCRYMVLDLKLMSYAWIAVPRKFIRF